MKTLIKEKAEENSTGLMARFMRATGGMIRLMEREGLFTLTETFMKGTG